MFSRIFRCQITFVALHQIVVRQILLLLLWLTSHICLVPTQMLYVNITVFTPLNVENVSS